MIHNLARFPEKRATAPVVVCVRQFRIVASE
jgi:hypothetical protein